MTSPLRWAAILLVALPVVPVQARDVRVRAATSQERATLAASQKFSARLSRLDALMGGVPREPVPTSRTRSAEAGR